MIKGKCLIDVIDHTISPMGGRLLKRWLALPSTDSELIFKRHNIVEYFINKEKHRSFLIETLSTISDLERLVSKVATKKINPRELFTLNESLKNIKPLKKEFKKTTSQKVILILIVMKLLVRFLLLIKLIV